jgi:hypothetical protein
MIAVAVSVPLVVLALALGAYAWWLNRKRRRRIELGEKMTMGGEVDACESALTREQFEERQRRAMAFEMSGDQRLELDGRGR